MLLLGEQYNGPVTEVMSYGGDDDRQVILRLRSVADCYGWSGQFGPPLVMTSQLSVDKILPDSFHSSSMGFKLNTAKLGGAQFGLADRTSVRPTSRGEPRRPGLPPG